jgi:regulatory protein
MDSNASRAAVITAVEKQSNRPRYNIYINDQYAFSVHEDVLVRHRLLKGTEVRQNEFERIMRDEEFNQAYTAAVQYLGRKARTAKEVMRKLKQRGYHEELAEQVISRLLRERFINDREYAAEFAQYHLVAHKKSRKWIAYKLAEKGVAQEYIDAALDALDSGEELRTAMDKGEKKWNSLLHVPPSERRKKVTAFLRRSGFSPDVVMKVMRSLQRSHNGANP